MIFLFDIRLSADVIEGPLSYESGFLNVCKKLRPGCRCPIAHAIKFETDYQAVLGLGRLNPMTAIVTSTTERRYAIRIS